MSDATIEARDLSKSFGVGARRARILHGVSLTVARGETVFLVGPSGSGKTTLLSILGCLLTPDEGSLRVLGHEIGGMNTDGLTAFRRRYVGFIFQSFNLFPTLSAHDNICLTLNVRGVSSRAARVQASRLLETLGLEHRAHLYPAHLSTGECQRVAIARALADSPALLFADEPTASLDAENGQRVMGLLTHLTRERGVTLVVVTHDSRIDAFADRILRLEDGRFRQESSMVRMSEAPPFATDDGRWVELEREAVTRCDDS